MADLALRSLVDDYTQRLVAIDAPDWYCNPAFKVVLQTDNAQVCADTPLTFAAGLLDVLQSDEPPSPDYFMTLPTPKGKFWGVYAALLTKEDEEPRLCIGSGTNATYGYSNRTEKYKNKTHHQLPRFVRLAYDKGYDLAHIGLLCWAPIPSVGIVPRARHRFVAVEAVFTNIFYSAFPTMMDSLWTNLMPWSRDAVLWAPSNSHTPLNEGPKGDLNLTPAELIAIDAEKTRRLKQLQPIQSKTAYDRERAADLEGYLKKKRIEKLAYTNKNRFKIQGQHRGTRQRAIASGKFTCKVCNVSLANSSGLKAHEATTAHKNQVEGVSKPQPTARQQLDKDQRDKAKADKTFYCSTCDGTFCNKSRLNKHLASKKHAKAKKVAAGKKS